MIRALVATKYMTEAELWSKVEEFFVENFDTDKHPQIDTIFAGVFCARRMGDQGSAAAD